MQPKMINIASGLATFVPGVVRFACGGSGGTDSPEYCYSVWLRHLRKLALAGVTGPFKAVAELGPGDSLGIGLAAVLSGTDRYYALDAMRHAAADANIRTLDELVGMFSRRAAIPGSDVFPEISPQLERLAFPHDLLTEDILRRSLAAERIDEIRSSLSGSGSSKVSIAYAAPWTDTRVVERESIDLVISQAVLEHVEDIQGTYDALFEWLAPGGIMSHQIDFKSHGITHDWYGHWTIPAWLWRIIRGRRPYLINRQPASVHIRAIANAGFKTLVGEPIHRQPPDRGQLAHEFAAATDDDLRTSGLFVIAQKPAAPKSS